MSIELDVAVCEVDSFESLSKILENGEVRLVIKDGVWEGRKVTSPNYKGSVELLKICQKFGNLFESRVSIFQQKHNINSSFLSEKLSYLRLCTQVIKWEEQTSLDLLLYENIFESLVKVILKTDEECDSRSFKLALRNKATVEHLFEEGLINKNVLGVIQSDGKSYAGSVRSAFFRVIKEDICPWTMLIGCPKV